MNVEGAEKLGWACIALVGLIVFVWTVLGVVAILGFLAYVCAYVGVVVLVLALLVRMLQLKLRLLVFCMAAGLLGAVVAISNLGAADDPYVVGICLLIGVFISLILQMMGTSTKVYRTITRPDTPRKEYLDMAGDRHMFAVCGYPQLPSAVRENPAVFLILFLGLWAVVVFIGLALHLYRVTDAATIWASLGAFVAGLALFEAYAVFRIERESGVEVFCQFLPGPAEDTSKFRLAAVLAKPTTWVAEFLQGLWDALREFCSIAVRA